MYCCTLRCMRLASSRPGLYTMQRHAVANRTKVCMWKIISSILLYACGYLQLGELRGNQRRKHTSSQDGSMFAKQRPNSLFSIGKTRLFETLILTRCWFASLGNSVYQHAPSCYGGGGGASGVGTGGGARGHLRTKPRAGTVPVKQGAGRTLYKYSHTWKI